MRSKLIAAAIGIVVAASILGVNALRSDADNDVPASSPAASGEDDNGVVSKSAFTQKGNRGFTVRSRRSPGADGVIGTKDDVVVPVNEDSDDTSSDEPGTDGDGPVVDPGPKPPKGEGTRPPVGDRPTVNDQGEEPEVRDHRDPNNDPNPPGGTTVEETPRGEPEVRDHRDEPEVRDHRDEDKPSWCKFTPAC